MNYFDTKLRRYYSPTVKCCDLDASRLRLVTLIFKWCGITLFTKNILIQTTATINTTMFDNIAAELYSFGYLDKIDDVEVVVNQFTESYGELDSLVASNYETVPMIDRVSFHDELMNRIVLYRVHKKKDAYIARFDTSAGYLLLLAFYVKYAGNMAISYGRYVDDPTYNGFADCDCETICVKRKDFNEFLSFMLNRKMLIKDWTPKFLDSNKMYVAEVRKHGDSMRFFRIKKTLPDALLDARFPESWKSVSSNSEYVKNNVEYLNYLEREIRIFMNRDKTNKNGFCYFK